jgi:alkaline phosphatase D
MLDLTKIAEAIRYEGGLSRRLFLAYGAALSSIPTLASRGNASGTPPKFANNPFTMGVASGEPSDSGVVLWTRLAPEPLVDGGGMPPVAVEVKWELGNDEGMKEIVQKGTAIATPQLAHAVHVEVAGLQPNRWYWYRFHVGDATSPVGRTRTMPDPTSLPEQMRFAFASCQHYETGLYTAYAEMAKDNLDLVVHLGDYIYEGPGRESTKTLKLIRKHHGPKLMTLENYRQRHAQYRTDPLLQGMHKLCPWLVTWDDHEFENNYAGPISEKKKADPVAFLEQRANSYQAYYEAMPLRRYSVPQGPNMKIYRTISFGRLATFQVLDTRQYRSDQPNDDKASDINEAAMDPHGTLLGEQQANWLKGALLKSPATWNILAQQVMMGMADRAPGEPKSYSMDQWPGYAYERIKLMKYIADRKIPNPVVLTGDIHSNWANDLRVDDRDMSTPIVASEFVGTSISSGGNGAKEIKNLDKLYSENPFIHYHDRQRGYIRCVVTPTKWQSDYQIVEDVITPGAPVTTQASFVVEAGKPGIKKA